MRNDWDRRGLPAWTYHNAALLELETSEVFLTHWQIAGHISDVANPGDYLTLDIGPERALVVRGQDGELRAFHNLCRHRGSRVAIGDKGHCKNALVCPFHGWVYNLDGTLRGPAQPRTFPDLDRKEFGLRAIEMQIWHGLIFLRFKPGPQADVADLLRPFEAELAPYNIDAMVPADQPFAQEIPVNWKSVRDVDNEGYHVALAHPALQDLYGFTYRDYPYDNGLSCAKGTYLAKGGRRWSVREYLKLSGGPAWLPEDRRTVWAYYGLFPNNVIVATPEAIQFYQEFPLGVEKARVRSALYKRRDESRREKLARYLGQRIDRETYAEDIQLSIWSNESMKSSAFEGFYLSDLERGLRIHHDQLRNLLPVMTLDRPPPSHELAAVNEKLKREKLQ